MTSPSITVLTSTHTICTVPYEPSKAIQEGPAVLVLEDNPERLRKAAEWKQQTVALGYLVGSLWGKTLKS